jgi:hypothetical protein
MMGQILDEFQKQDMFAVSIIFSTVTSAGIFKLSLSIPSFSRP